MHRACVRRGDITVTALRGFGVVMRFMSACNRDAWLESVRQRTWSVGRTVTRGRLPSKCRYLRVCAVAKANGTQNGEGEEIPSEDLGDLKETAYSRRFPRTF